MSIAELSGSWALPRRASYAIDAVKAAEEIGIEIPKDIVDNACIYVEVRDFIATDVLPAIESVPPLTVDDVMTGDTLKTVRHRALSYLAVDTAKMLLQKPIEQALFEAAATCTSWCADPDGLVASLNEVYRDNFDAVFLGRVTDDLRLSELAGLNDRRSLIISCAQSMWLANGHHSAKMQGEGAAWDYFLVARWDAGSFDALDGMTGPNLTLPKGTNIFEAIERCGAEPRFPLNYGEALDHAQDIAPGHVYGVRFAGSNGTRTTYELSKEVLGPNANAVVAGVSDI
ncbi:hypothetical protein FK268_11205 [Tsukamurella sputi]|uniref:Uncharacterized protein n=1 Tax=Tsukamurella sputi TaxID=2591848 RepID=A0A5C5RNW7_9ACTN|nr:hypothetical protein [Tsukamurella sputi]TWS24173.1 hypothetical protein FK268_11205 [Tsukamurella sputi]